MVYHILGYLTGRNMSGKGAGYTVTRIRADDTTASSHEHLAAVPVAC